MSRRYLGVTIDLHGGGADLLYPHHESERAQSESANKAPFARRWLHTGMVRYQGEKMSKSLGNLVFPRDLLRDHEPAAIRLALLAHHWRSAWEWDPAELKEAAERLSTWRQACGQPRTPDARSATLPFGGPSSGGLGLARGCPRRSMWRWPTTWTRRRRWPSGTSWPSGGTGPGSAAAAAVLGVELGPARLSRRGWAIQLGVERLGCPVCVGTRSRCWSTPATGACAGSRSSPPVPGAGSR